MTLNSEKADLEAVDQKSLTESQILNDARIAEFSPEETRKVLHKIDRRLVLTLSALYCCSLVDRSNLGAANIAGMAKSLQLTGNRYQIIALVFFIPYVLFQPPATIVLRKLGPRVFLSAITILWGATMICFGFVKKWDQMVGLRIILGVLEAGFFPGCAYLLSCWYTRFELQKRYAVFYLIGSMASAFASILAYGLMQMNGLAGLSGWRWIFIMLGIITCVCGIAGYFLLVDFPELSTTCTSNFLAEAVMPHLGAFELGGWEIAEPFELVSALGTCSPLLTTCINMRPAFRFLSKREADFVVARIEKDRADVIPTPFALGAYLMNALDPKIWGFAVIFGLSTLQTYAISYFLPIILLNGMGFSIAKAQCLVAPPYVLAAVVMYGCAILGDRYHIRAPIIIGNAILGLIGLPLLRFAKNNAVRYFGVFLATTAANANVPAILTYQANNIRGQWKRAFCSASLIGMGGIGGIMGSTVFRDQDAPAYGPGIMACIIGNGLIILIVLVLRLTFSLANKKADKGEKIIEGQEGFRYTL